MSEPIAPPAPGLFSMTKAWLNDSCSFCATTRAAMSGALARRPGHDDPHRTMRIRLRQCCASGENGNQKYAETGGERGKDSHRSSSSEGADILERAGVQAAIHEEILTGDEAGLGAAQERAGVAELLDRAEAPGGIRFGAHPTQLFHAFPRFLRI